MNRAAMKERGEERGVGLEQHDCVIELPMVLACIELQKAIKLGSIKFLNTGDMTMEGHGANGVTMSDHVSIGVW